MAKEKNKPVPVRFDLKLLEVLKEEEKIDTPQQALNFLSKFWENNRPATGDFAAGLKDVQTADGKGVQAHEPIAGGPGLIEKGSGPGAKASGSVAKGKEREAIAHPSGLSGIDLAIWKAEQKEKNG